MVLMKCAIFDIDHTITKPIKGRYPKKNNFIINPVAANLIRMLNADHNWLVLAYSNQGGVEAGYTTVEDVQEYFAQIQKILNTTYKTFITSFYSCYSNNKDNPYRKPNPHMYYYLSNKWGIDTISTIYIGDASSEKNFSTSDRDFARNAQISYVDIAYLEDLVDKGKNPLATLKTIVHELHQGTGVENYVPTRKEFIL